MRDAAHLPFVQEAAYRRLLDAYYIREGPLPGDRAQCERLARAGTKAERDAVGAVLAAYFELRDDGYHQSRADREIERYIQKRSKATSSSALGVAARAAKKRAGDEPPGAPSGKPSGQPNGQPKGQPLHSPVTNSEAIASGGSPPPQPVDLIFGLGLPALQAAGVSDKNARSMLGQLRKLHGDEALVAAIQRMADERPLEPVAWLQATLRTGPARSKAVSFRERDAEATRADVNRWGGGLVTAKPERETIEMEQTHARLHRD